jgi:hypothetical protein
MKSFVYAAKAITMAIIVIRTRANVFFIMLIRMESNNNESPTIDVL